MTKRASQAGEALPRRGDRPPRVHILLLLVGLVIAYLPKVAPPIARQLGFDLSGWGPPAVVLWNWLAVGVLLVYVTRAERLPLRSLRLVRPSEADLNWAGWLGGAAVLWHWLAATWIVPGSDPVSGPPTSGSAALVALGPLMALVLVVTVSITEEILWRGYVVERLSAWIGAIPAAVIGLAIFTLGHLAFFGPSWLVTVLPGAVLVYVLLLWRRNLYACMLAHMIGNIPIVIVALVS